MQLTHALVPFSFTVVKRSFLRFILANTESYSENYGT